MNGYVPNVTPQPATKSQLIALRDYLLNLGLSSSASAVDNAIDCIQQDATIAFRLEEMRGQFEEYEADYADLKATQEDARQVGLQ